MAPQIPFTLFRILIIIQIEFVSSGNLAQFKWRWCESISFRTNNESVNWFVFFYLKISCSISIIHKLASTRWFSLLDNRYDSSRLQLYIDASQCTESRKKMILPMNLRSRTKAKRHNVWNAICTAHGSTNIYYVNSLQVESEKKRKSLRNAQWTKLSGIDFSWFLFEIFFLLKCRKISIENNE